jgi:HK97 family phage prohead protease
MENRRQETNIETRFSVMPETQATVINAETRTIRGYGIVFNKESVDLRIGGRVFREVIRPEAAQGVDFSDVLSMHNHKSERLLGRTGSGTMRTGVDDIGVWYEVDLPNSPTGEDVLVSVSRRDTQGSSFQFDIEDTGDKWSVRNGKAYREVIKFRGVYEMGPVSEPAYPDATINKKSRRSLEALVESDDYKKALDLEKANTWDLQYMVDNAAWALQRGNEMVSSLNNWVWNYDYWAEEGKDKSAMFTNLARECKAAKAAILSLINSHADAIKDLNNSENRSQRAAETTEETPTPEPTQTDFQALADAELAEFQQMQLLTL